MMNYRMLNMNRLHRVTLLFLVCIADTASANVSDSAGFVAPLIIRDYTGVLEAPFGVTRIRINQSPDGRVTSLKLNVMGEMVNLEPELLVGLVDLSLPQLTYNPNKLPDKGEISSFEVYFRFGPTFLLNLPEGRWSKREHTQKWEQAMVIFKVDKDLHVTRTILSEEYFRKIVEQ